MVSVGPVFWQYKILPSVGVNDLKLIQNPIESKSPPKVNSEKSPYVFVPSNYRPVYVVKRLFTISTSFI